MNTVDMSRASRVPSVGRRAATMELNTPAEIVRAAGGLIVRRQSGQLEVALVHRPMHQDWSYPKGKLEEGETFEDAAQREVLEETGFICRLLRFVGHTDYIDRKGRPKVVAYWVMSAVAGTFVPNEEVDELRWVDVAAAGGLLSYERDRELLAVVAADDQLEPLI
jgi:8-oxo-dGTP diphosphatase